MRVLLVCGTYPPADCGVGDYTARLAGELHRRGVAVAVLTGARGSRGLPIFDRGSDGPATHEPGTALRSMTDDRRSGSAWPVFREVSRWNLSALGQVREAARRWSAKIVHLQFPSAAYAGLKSAAVTFLPAYLRAALPTAGTIVTLHDFAIGSPPAKLRSTALVLGASAVTVSNQRDLEAAREWFPRGAGRRVRQVRIGANISPVSVGDAEMRQLRRRMGLGDGSWTIGYFGLISRSKRLELLLDAAAGLTAEFPPLRCLMIGTVVDTGYWTELKCRVDRLGLRDRVIWTGRQKPDDVSRLLRLCDLAVLPFERGADFRRGSLLACLEHSVPVITNSHTRYGVDTELADCGAVELVHTVAAADWQRAIRSLLVDEPKRRHMRAAGLRLSEPFAWPAVAAAMEQLYAEVARGPEELKAASAVGGRKFLESDVSDGPLAGAPRRLLTTPVTAGRR